MAVTGTPLLHMLLIGTITLLGTALPTDVLATPMLKSALLILTLADGGAIRVTLDR